MEFKHKNIYIYTMTKINKNVAVSNVAVSNVARKMSKVKNLNLSWLERR